MPDAIAISASATNSPPSDISCTAVTEPVADQAAHEIAVAAFGGEIDRRRRALLAAADVAQIDAIDRASRRFADQQDRLALALEGERHRFREIVEQMPTPPMVGVGRIALPLVSL